MAARLTGWKIDIKAQAVAAEFQNDNQDEEEVERV
jgi:transcription antitermination factor NusA-like protein